MTTAEVIATETLKCGLLDLQLLDKTSYNFEDYYEKGLGFNQCIERIVHKAICDSGLEAKAKTIGLNIWNDVEIWTNYLNSSCSIIKNEKKYKKYCRTELEKCNSLIVFCDIANVRENWWWDDEDK